MLECPPDRIVTDDRFGLKVCSDTGEVLEENIISDEPEWHAYTTEERLKRQRVGVISHTLAHMGIGARLGGFRGSKGALSKVRGFRRLPLVGRVNKRRSSGKEGEVLKLIYDISCRMSLTDNIREEAARFYRMMYERGLTKNYNTLVSVIVSLYLACRVLRIPCMFEDFLKTVEALYELREEELELLRRDVLRVYKRVVKAMSLNIPLLESEKYIEKLAVMLGIPEHVVTDAINMFREAREKGYMLKGHFMGLAAGLLYLAVKKHKLNITQDKIAETAGVTSVTLRKRAIELSKYVAVDNKKVP